MSLDLSLLKIVEVLGVQILDGRDDQTLNLHVGVSLGQVLGVDGLVLGSAHGRHADPAVRMAGGDEDNLPLTR